MSEHVKIPDDLYAKLLDGAERVVTNDGAQSANSSADLDYGHELIQEVLDAVHALGRGEAATKFVIGEGEAWTVLHDVRAKVAAGLALADDPVPCACGDNEASVRVSDLRAALSGLSEPTEERQKAPERVAGGTCGCGHSWAAHSYLGTGCDLCGCPYGGATTVKRAKHSTEGEEGTR